MISRPNIPTSTSISTASPSKGKNTDRASTLASSNVVEPFDSTGGQPGKVLPSMQGPTTKGKSIEGPDNAPSQAHPSNAVHQEHQKRPGGVGTHGAIVFLSTNYFQVDLEQDFRFYRYSIQVSPEAKGRKLAQMIKDALDLPEFNTLRPYLVSDFAAVLLSTQILADDLLKVSVPYKKNLELKPLDDAQDPSDAEAASRYYVIFDYTREVDITNGLRTQISSADQDKLPIVQDLDIVLGNHRKCSPDICMIGKRRAFQIEEEREGECCVLSRHGRRDQTLLVAFRGFFSSVRLSTRGMLLNMNVTHGTFYLERDLSTWLRMIQNHPEVHITKVPSLLKGLRVRLLHLPSKTEFKGSKTEFKESKTGSKTVFRTISGYASPGQGAGYEAHPPLVPDVKAGPLEVKFFEYKSTKPTMGQKDKESAKKGLLAAHTLGRCGCDGSYTSVSTYFKRSMPQVRPLGLL